MSAPYPQQPPSGPARRSLELKEILALAAAGAGGIGYLLGFFDEAAGVALGSNAGFALIVAAVLAGLRFVPRTPNGLFAAAPLAAYAALAMLQQLLRGTAGGLGIVLVLAALVQCVAVFGVLLADGGVLKIGASAQPRPNGQPPHSSQPGVLRAPGGPGGPGARFGPGGPANGGWAPQGKPAQGPPAHPGQPGPPNPPWGQPQQPGSRPPSSDGAPVPGGPQPESGGQQVPGGPGQQGPGQQAQYPPSGPQPASKPEPDNGPQGTRQMPHPGANPSNY
ncbi:hypothetical protein GCM10009854_02770 [Saccharopolyspora halophila]|uniref:Cell surface protein n=1 Tax=Saccharopolyspora halophila TaxID=405551 RepID=A0ABN3FIQ3_9PSEU